MIRIAGIILTTPTDLGPAIGDYRGMLRYTRSALAAEIAARTGGNLATVTALLRRWETGDTDPTLSALGPVLDALGCDLALIPREDTT